MSPVDFKKLGPCRRVTFRGRGPLYKQAQSQWNEIVRYMVYHTFFNGQLVESHIPIHISICLTIDSVILSKQNVS